MNQKLYRFGWIITLVVLTVMACGGLGGIAEGVEDVEHAAQTAQALATAGQEIATQIEGAATKVGESGAMQTAQALATEASESGLMETMEAAITELPEEGAEMEATIEAAITQGAYGEAPENIPIVPGETNYFFGNSSLVSYTTAMEFSSVLDFYRTSMPEYGWQPGANDTIETSSYAILSYQNSEQKATVSLTASPGDVETIVAINISNK